MPPSGHRTRTVLHPPEGTSARTARPGVVRLRPPSSRGRFVSGDRYRAEREWQRYEGTAQRDLFRELRERFLSRHTTSAAFAIDVGSGPGRYTAQLGTGATTRRVALDIGREMLRALPSHWGGPLSAHPVPDLVQGDGLRPPFPRGAFGIVAALGNIVGFAEGESDRFLDSVIGLLAPGATLLLEVAPGPGERSRYLHRLPAGSVARLLRAPTRIVSTRVEREGFVPEPQRRKDPGEFRRTDPSELSHRLEGQGFLIEEIVAIAPALGPEAVRIDAVQRDPKAWAALLELEEALGRSPDRWTGAAAVLVAAIGPGDDTRRRES